MTLRLDEATVEHALTAMLVMTGMLDAEHQGLKARGVWGLERGTARRRHEDMDRHTRALTAAMITARQEGAGLPPIKDVIRALSDVAALVEVARQTLSVEDYGDALDGAAKRLMTLIAQLSPGGGSGA